MLQQSIIIVVWEVVIFIVVASAFEAFLAKV